MIKYKTIEAEKKESVIKIIFKKLSIILSSAYPMVFITSICILLFIASIIDLKSEKGLGMWSIFDSIGIVIAGIYFIPLLLMLLFIRLFLDFSVKKQEKITKLFSYLVSFILSVNIAIWIKYIMQYHIGIIIGIGVIVFILICIAVEIIANWIIKKKIMTAMYKKLKKLKWCHFLIISIAIITLLTLSTYFFTDNLVITSRIFLPLLFIFLIASMLHLFNPVDVDEDIAKIWLLACLSIVFNILGL